MITITKGYRLSIDHVNRVFYVANELDSMMVYSLCKEVWKENDELTKIDFPLHSDVDSEGRFHLYITHEWKLIFSQE